MKSSHLWSITLIPKTLEAFFGCEILVTFKGRESLSIFRLSIRVDLEPPQYVMGQKSFDSMPKEQLFFVCRRETSLTCRSIKQLILFQYYISFFFPIASTISTNLLFLGKRDISCIYLCSRRFPYLLAMWSAFHATVDSFNQSMISFS
jgi:hypothetical protein